VGHHLFQGLKEKQGQQAQQGRKAKLVSLVKQENKGHKVYLESRGLEVKLAQGEKPDKPALKGLKVSQAEMQILNKYGK
jgi:hypothetical protein